MPHRLLNFGRKPAADASEGASSRQGAGWAGASGKLPADVPDRIPTSQAAAALELAQELVRGIEHFVLSTPDLDTPGFLNRLRRIAAQITPGAMPDDLNAHRQWAIDSLSAFGQLQRRYLSEREDELWRLLNLYQEHQKVDTTANKQFHETLRGVHERLGNVMRLTDLRQVRERLESEIQRATALVDQKSRADEERAVLLAAQVQSLEAALVAARHEALQDAMTGVYHRGAFQSQLEALLETSTPCALAMIDIDNFKDINDNLGHLVGDQILKLAVQALSQVGRPGEVLGRYGGDEFCFLSPGTPADRLADRLESIAAPRVINFQFEKRHCSVRLSLSVGVAGSVADDVPESLMRRADGALYEVKRAGKGHARVAAAPTLSPA